LDRDRQITFGQLVVSLTSGADWRDVRVLITGARGFIGGRLCQRLVQAGAIVHAVTSRANLSGLSSAVAWSTVDLTDLDAVGQMVRGHTPDVVFHLASHVTGSQALVEVERTFAQNLVTTVHLLTSAAEVGGCRVVLAGSMQEPDRNDTEGVPVSPYAVSKWASTAYARMFHRLYEFPIVVARLMMVYGPGQWDVTKLVPHVTTTLLDGRSPSLSSGTRMIDWVYVDDVVDGLITLAMTAGAEGKTVDLGSGMLTSIRDIVEQLSSLIGSSPQLTFGGIPDRPFDRPVAARTDETRLVTGWSAETALADGLGKTVEWYRNVWEPEKRG
jgi:nucleoside-diphosphate-sugar epimerase